MKSKSIENQIVIINQEAGYLTIDVANYLSEKYDESAIISGRISQRKTSLNSSIKRHKIFRYRRTSNSWKLLSWIIAFIQILFLIKTRYRKAHLFIFSNPPIAPLVTLFSKHSYSLYIFDVFPDAIYEFKMHSQNGVFIRYWSKANKKVYSKAQYIYTITKGMKSKLEKYCAKKKIEVVPLWTDNNHLKPLDRKTNPFIKKYGLENKFIISYSGNLGIASNIEALIDIAKIINDPNIFFLIIGDGAKKKELENKITALKLNNCLLLHLQTLEILPYSLAAANLSVVNLGKNASTIGIPSKIYNYMSVGSPIMGISSNKSELANLIRELNIGANFESESISEMTEFILNLTNDHELERRFGSNSLLASRNYTIRNIEKIKF